MNHSKAKRAEAQAAQTQVSSGGGVASAHRVFARVLAIADPEAAKRAKR
jgi:hypothetical protein